MIVKIVNQEKSNQLKILCGIVRKPTLRTILDFKFHVRLYKCLVHCTYSKGLNVQL